MTGGFLFKVVDSIRNIDSDDARTTIRVWDSLSESEKLDLADGFRHVFETLLILALDKAEDQNLIMRWGEVLSKMNDRFNAS